MPQAQRCSYTKSKPPLSSVQMREPASNTIHTTEQVPDSQTEAPDRGLTQPYDSCKSQANFEGRRLQQLLLLTAPCCNSAWFSSTHPGVNRCPQDMSCQPAGSLTLLACLEQLPGFMSPDTITAVQLRKATVPAQLQMHTKACNVATAATEACSAAAPGGTVLW